jgi:hypothetical protein
MLVLNESFEVFKGHCRYALLSHNIILLSDKV